MIDICQENDILHFKSKVLNQVVTGYLIGELMSTKQKDDGLHRQSIGYLDAKRHLRSHPIS